MAVHIYSRHCKEMKFECQHKLFREFKKITPESMSFDTTAKDSEGDTFNLSWQIKYSLTDLHNFGYGTSNNHFKMDLIEVNLLDELAKNDTAYVNINVCGYTSIDLKFDSKSFRQVKKKIPDLIIKNDNNESFIHLKISLIHEDRSISRMIDNYNSFVKSEKSCNVALKVDDDRFTAHREILSAHSPVFASMFDNNWIEGSTNAVNIKDVEPGVMKHLLDYIYRAKIHSKDIQDWLKIIVAADRYSIMSLVSVCEGYISDRLNAENVADVLTIADLVKSEELKKECLKFIVENNNEVVKTSGYKNLVAEHTDLVTEILSFIMHGCSLALKKESDEKKIR